MTETNGGPDEDRPDGSGVGTVAEEAARLVELLTGSGRGAAGSADTPFGADGTGQPDGGASGACTCGGRRPAACSTCPVCQLIAFVQRVSPETIDRLAEVVELAATGLRDLAVVQRARRERDETQSRETEDQPSTGDQPSTEDRREPS